MCACRECIEQNDCTCDESKRKLLTRKDWSQIDFLNLLVGALVRIENIGYITNLPDLLAGNYWTPPKLLVRSRLELDTSFVLCQSPMDSNINASISNDDDTTADAVELFVTIDYYYTKKR